MQTPGLWLPSFGHDGERAYIRRTRAAGGAFSPLDIAGCQLWLDASQESYNDNDAVGTWTDRSGNSRNATQATAGSKPAYKTAVVNSLAVMRFDGNSNDFLVLPDFLTSYTAGTGFAVVKAAADPALDDPRAGPIFSVGNAGFSSHNPYNDGNVYDGFGTAARHSTGNPTASLANWHCWVTISAASDWRAYINGVQHYSTGTNTVSWTTTPQIGNHPGQNKYYNGDMAELILYSSALSTGDRQSVEAYLNSKYALGF